jgi:hypothetical protein
LAKDILFLEIPIFYTYKRRVKSKPKKVVTNYIFGHVLPPLRYFGTVRLIATISCLVKTRPGNPTAILHAKKSAINNMQPVSKKVQYVACQTNDNRVTCVHVLHNKQKSSFVGMTRLKKGKKSIDDL